MIFIKSIDIQTDKHRNSNKYPFTIPVVRNFSKLEFTSPVTFFVGENGSGKSTLMEAIAVALNAVAVGSDNLRRDASLKDVTELADNMKFSSKGVHRRGFFLRAEDFFGFVKRIKSEIHEYQELEKEFDGKFEGYAKMLTVGMARGQHRALARKYGDNPDAFSHGESFLNLFESRMVPEGLYILDEPEAPLSPQRQLSLLSIMKRMVAQNCQFIIATHSPLLMAFPDAQILHFNEGVITDVDYEDVEHVSLTKSFLKDPERYLRML